MRKFILLFYFLLIFWNVSYSENFLFTKIINDVPYIIINKESALKYTQSFLLHSFLMGDTYRGQNTIRFDTKDFEINRRLNLYWDVREYKLWSIVGTPYSLENTIGFKPGDKLIMQYVTQDGSGEQKEIFIDKIYFNISGSNSAIILKCKPVKVSSAWFNEIHKFSKCPYITYSPKYQGAGVPFKSIDIKIPKKIEFKADSLSQLFYPKDSPKEYQNLTIQKFRGVKNQLNTFYYSIVISYGDKGTTGILYLLDSKGEYVNKIENKNFNKILGITDANNDGNHELIVLMGDSYGGGIEVFGLPFHLNNNQIQSYSKIDTMFD